MKKKILALLMGCLFVGANAFAAGDLQVNGSLGIGMAPNSATKAIITGTNTRGASLTVSMDQDGVVGANILKGLQLRSNITGTASGTANGIGLITDISSTASNINLGVGGAFVLSLSSNTSGSTTVAETATGKFDTVFNGGNRAYTITKGYGFNLILRDNSLAQPGSLHIDDYRGININNADNAYGKISADNLTGIWIDKQTLGGTKNYGIVLNGDGAGADIVLGASQNTSIYASGGEIFVKDGGGFATQISPHDPETGEWRFYSKNVKTGRVVEVNMEKLVKAVEKLTGEKFMVETMERTN
jgi:hypothetical protein